MTAPDRPTGPGLDGAGLARAWADVLVGSSFVALDRAEVEQLTTGLTELVRAALAGGDADRPVGNLAHARVAKLVAERLSVGATSSGR